ncbi:MAG: type IV toxin-antitoxin system AbiEi family antitoxin domain-containing protein [Salinivirgaceae bacterium]|nr:type IV toxin-antitoxin system AbiEi family antitoxin domain-containing protein [Salinivirgaceae bacterium]
MKLTDLIKYKIDRFAEGYIFTYSDFDIDVKNESALKVALYRLVKSGKIERLSKGKFYKPKQGIIGKLKPDEYEIVKDLLKDGNKINGYITGYSIFNRLKLTTQVPNVIQIGVNLDKKEIKRGMYTIKFVRQWNKITKKNIPLLQILDCVRFIKNIPDTNIDQSFNRILNLIKKLSEADRKSFVELAINYPPASRALTGAILEEFGAIELSGKLFKTLKSTSWYKLNISDSLIVNKKKWRIQ